MTRKKKLKLLAPNPTTGGGYEEGDGMCCCPVCAEPYNIGDTKCEHFLGDWCFTVDYERGTPKGNWATDDGNNLLADVCAAMETLQQMLDDDEVQPEEHRESLMEFLSTHLQFSLDDFRGLLNDRVAAAPGYIGSTEIETAHMASDAWDVHWATDAAAAARHIEKQFKEDLKVLQKALDMASTDDGADT